MPKTPDQLLEQAIERAITAREEWRAATVKVGIVFAEQELDEQWTGLTKRQRLGILPLLLDEEVKSDD